MNQKPGSKKVLFIILMSAVVIFILCTNFVINSRNRSGSTNFLAVLVRQENLTSGLEFVSSVSDKPSEKGNKEEKRYWNVISKLSLTNDSISRRPPFENLSVINIAIVTCSGKKSRRSHPSTLETLTLIKSILISMKLYQLDNKAAFQLHVFTDTKPLQEYLHTEIAKYIEAVNGAGSVNFQISFYSALEAVVPHTMVDGARGQWYHACAYTRLFFPEVLPLHLKTVLFLDTDVIVTGNISKIWNHFSSPILKNKSLLAALVGAAEPGDTKYPEIFQYHFAPIPHVPPKGVNAGIMLMNLEGMRQIKFTAECKKIFNSRAEEGKNFNDQQIINQFFHYNLDKIKVFGCQYNFAHTHCERGWACKRAAQDPEGVQLVHGAGGTFSAATSTHFAISEAFRKFNISDHAQVVDKLLKPLKAFYTNVKNRSTCNGALGPYLFPQIRM